MTTPDLATRWLSPTSAWQLITCPASLGTPRSTWRSLEPNAGTLAHRAMQLWVETGDWANPVARRESLVSGFDASARSAQVDIALLRDGRTTRARLAARADELANELAELTSDGASIACEQALSDPLRRLRGIPDITIHGQRSAVIDLKTGRDATAPVTDRIRIQLLTYAHLYRCAHDRLPEIVEAFSLIHGPLRISADHASVEELLSAITMARFQDPNLALPSPTVCKFCARRFFCEPHWDAISTWDAPDALEGRTVQVEHARNGAAALLIETASGPQWVTHIPPDRLPAEAAAGSYVRIIHAYRTNTRDPQPATPAWRSAPLIDIHICRPDGARNPL